MVTSARAGDSSVPTDLTNMIELASGRFLSLVHPDPDDIMVQDIAHGLALTCRFSGQCRRFYSVGEHALLVADRLREVGYGVRTQLAGLHHDDGEAFVTDVPRPAKVVLPDYALLEEVVLAACLKSLFGSEPIDVHGRRIKEADNWALAQEAGELMPSRGKHWYLGHEWDGQHRSLGMAPHEAEREWLSAHRRLFLAYLQENDLFLGATHGSLV